MEGIGSEVSHKIRAAIKAKLIELGAYVDDELPDYIMVMVANKRTKSQMDEDLQLFLSSNTKLFTTWLHTVLHKLHEVTIAGFDKADKGDSEKKKSKRKKSRSEESTVKSEDEEESVGKKIKKHKKQHKESKKPKKNKHKKAKTKEQAKKKTREEREVAEDSGLQVTHEVGKAILDVLKKRDAEMLNQASATVGSHMGNGVESGAGNLIPDQDEPDAVPSYPADAEVVDPSPHACDAAVLERVDLVADDEFNIEPLIQESPPSVEEETVTTVLAPTMELLKEHDKLLSQQEKEQKQEQSDSEGSVSPEELRRQLLLSRAKRKIEERRHSGRGKSTSPDIVILDHVDHVDITPRVTQPAVADKPGPAPKSPVVHRPRKFPSSDSSRHSSRDGKKQQAVSSRIVTLPPPEAPDIPSVVKVKPREYISKEKQANRNLILKAVAAAEKSIATAVPVLNASSVQTRKAEGLFTRDLRDKKLRRENIAVTLTNDNMARMDKPKALSSGTGGSKADSERDSDRPKTVDNREGDDQFISSKPTSQSNDKYIECWLAGVHKAVEHSEMLNPSDMELEAADRPPAEEATTLKDGENKTVAARKDDVQIVVTLDGLLSRGMETKPRSIGERFTRLNRTTGEAVESKEPKTTVASTAGASRNKQLIAQLSEKFGKVDREFENKRKRFELEEEDEDKERRHRRTREGGASSRERRSREVLVEDVKRCLFWPSCSKGDGCEYYHPAAPPCELLLPNIKLQDKSKYIHEQSEDDVQGTSRHTKARRSGRAVQGRSSRSQPSSLCKFHPDCLSKECRFYHPSTPKRQERQTTRSSGEHRRRKWSSRS